MFQNIDNKNKNGVEYINIKNIEPSIDKNISLKPNLLVSLFMSA